LGRISLRTDNLAWSDPNKPDNDDNGNLTSVTNSCGTTTFSWDVRNRLVSINGFNADCSSLTAYFKYDALGRRIEKSINARTIQYFYDEQDIIQEIENGQVITNYLRTLNIDEPLAIMESNGALRYYHTDALGSVITMTDENGEIKTTYTYDPFGNVTSSGEQNDNLFQYTGRENDGTGLYYYRARYYSPGLQRFISEDPIGLLGGLNLYAYVGNNPINSIDPEGKGPILFKICLALTIADIAATTYSLNKYAKEQEEISKRINKILQSCETQEDLLKRMDEIEALKKQAIEAARKETKARMLGYVSGIGIATICLLSFFPFLP
jgi:RHS repeat-associated protein